MKTKNKLFLFTSTVVLLGACNSAELGEKAETSEAREVNKIEGENVVYAVNPDNSIIEWTGSKPTGTHVGTIALKESELIVKDGMLAGGAFFIDMKSIVNHDLEDEGWNTKLVNHLHSEDFFHTDLHPEARFEITSIEEYEGDVEEGMVQPTHTISGNLTIKDITKNIRFDAVVNMQDNKIIAESESFVIDRTDWDVKYKSKKIFDNLKDDFIHDEIGLKIKLESSLQS